MAKRADNNDGSCREILKGRHAGKWRVQFVVVGDTGLKTRISRIFATKSEAKTFLQQVRRGERIEEVKRQRELTLGEWFEWLAVNDWPETLASVTVAQRRSRFKKYVEKHFGATPLSKIDPIQVRAFYKRLRDEGARPTLILSVKSDLVRAFNQAITPYQRIPMTLANPFRLPLPQPSPREAVALTPEEVKAAIHLRDLTTGGRAMLGLFLLAGLRLGEMMALSRGQLRFDDDLIVIDRAVQVEFGGKQSIGLPKGRKTRNAVMCRTLKDALAPYALTMPDETLLFAAESANKPRMKKVFYRGWEAARKASGLPSDMSPHDCRLTHINIIEKMMPRVSITCLKEHVGHAASGVTEANYTRPITSAQRVLRDELDRVFGVRKRHSK